MEQAAKDRMAQGLIIRSLDRIGVQMSRIREANEKLAELERGLKEREQKHAALLARIDAGDVFPTSYPEHGSEE